MRARLAVTTTILLLALSGATRPTAAQDPNPLPPDPHLLLDDTAGGPMLDASRVRPDADGKTFVDPSSNTVFPTGITVTTRSGEAVHLTATGSGVRKKLLFKVYAAALYVDALAPLGTVPVNTIASTDMARRIVMVFLRDVDGDKLREGLREGFETVWKGKPGPELAAELDTFLSWMAGGIKEGQTIELTYLPGEGLYTTVAGVTHPAITRPDIARSIWQIWLGVEPISGDLKRDLVRLTGDTRR
jgi:hypothetical protein